MKTKKLLSQMLAAVFAPAEEIFHRPRVRLYEKYPLSDAESVLPNDTGFMK